MSQAQEAEYLRRINESPHNMMIVCTVAGEIAGNCQLVLRAYLKTNHRASIAIGLISKYWGLGIGTAMLKQLAEVARRNGVTQLELECIEGNSRALRLYEKEGFREAAKLPNAFRFKDGSYHSEIIMIKEI